MTRQQDVADLREVGMSFDYIAHRLGITPEQARRLSQADRADEQPEPGPSRSQLLRRRGWVENSLGCARTVGQVWAINQELAEIDSELRDLAAGQP